MTKNFFAITIYGCLDMLKCY